MKHIMFVLAAALLHACTPPPEGHVGSHQVYRGSVHAAAEAWLCFPAARAAALAAARAAALGAARAAASCINLCCAVQEAFSPSQEPQLGVGHPCTAHPYT